MERNDALLLACGWTYEPKRIAYAWQSPDKSWKGFHDRPRPYENEHDAIALVPEGWGWGLHKNSSEDIFGPSLVQAFVSDPENQRNPGKGIYAHFERETGAEALAEAIMKAVGNTREDSHE